MFLPFFQVRGSPHYGALGKTSPCICLLAGFCDPVGRRPTCSCTSDPLPAASPDSFFLLPPSSPLDVFSKRKRGRNERRNGGTNGGRPLSFPLITATPPRQYIGREAAGSMQREDRAQKGACPHSDASSNVCGVQSNLCTCFCLKL